MDDDLAVPQALALISNWLRAGNTALGAGDFAAAREEAKRIRGALDVLGCDPLDDAFTAQVKSDGKALDALDALVRHMLKEREEARAKKDFAVADRIRDSFEKLGITIEDGPEGPRWSIR